MPEIFSKKMDELLRGLPGVVKSMDDFLIFGKTKIDHDKRVRKVMDVMEENGMTLNIEVFVQSRRSRISRTHNIQSGSTPDE